MDKRAETYFNPKSLDPVDFNSAEADERGVVAMATARVWDGFVRFFHWGLVASFAVAWISGDDWKTLHIWAGYAAAALIAMRLDLGAGRHAVCALQPVR